MSKRTEISEAELLKLVMLALTKEGHRVFRCNRGMSWTGQLVEDYRNVNGERTITLRNARPFHAGFVDGASDLIGFSRDGRFIALELKSRRGRLSPEQKNFIAQVQAHGGIAGVVRSTEDALRLVRLGFN